MLDRRRRKVVDRDTWTTWDRSTHRLAVHLGQVGKLLLTEAPLLRPVCEVVMAKYS